MIITPQLGWRPDKQAERILFDRFWTPQGWKHSRTTPPADFVYAQRAGYMFGSVAADHDALIDDLIQLRSRLATQEIAQAFSDSLTSKRLDLRSALGSYGAILRLPEHHLGDVLPSAEKITARYCSVCKLYLEHATEDLDVLSFERFKWGGVRHSNPLYAVFDLLQFAAAEPDAAGQTKEPLLRILDAASTAPANARPGDLLKMIAPYLPGNSAQRRVVLECLSYAGILQPTSHAGFFSEYPIHREHCGGKNDWGYPMMWWRGRDGVNEEALRFYFPDLRA